LAAAATLVIAPELVYFGARPLSEVVAAHLLVIACYLIEPGYRIDSRRRMFVAGFLLGLVCLLRILLVPAIAVIALWSISGRRRAVSAASDCAGNAAATGVAAGSSGCPCGAFGHSAQGIPLHLPGDPPRDGARGDRARPAGQLGDRVAGAARHAQG